jgi:hypothetical protein
MHRHKNAGLSEGGAVAASRQPVYSNGLTCFKIRFLKRPRASSKTKVPARLYYLRCHVEVVTPQAALLLFPKNRNNRKAGNSRAGPSIDHPRCPA